MRCFLQIRVAVALQNHKGKVRRRSPAKSTHCYAKAPLDHRGGRFAPSVTADLFLGTCERNRRRRKGRSMSRSVASDFDIEEQKDAAADVLYQYSQFVMVCIGEGVRPSDLRLHLMKEISGIPTSLRRNSSTTSASQDSICPSSSGTMRTESI